MSLRNAFPDRKSTTGNHESHLVLPGHTTKALEARSKAARKPGREFWKMKWIFDIFPGFARSPKKPVRHQFR